MSAVLEPQAPASVPANDDTVEVIDRAEIHDGKAVVQYSRTEMAIAELQSKYKGAKYDLTTVAGDKAARAARLELVTIGARLEDKRKELKAPALAFGRLVDSEAARLTALIEELKEPIQKQIKDDEDRRETIRLEKAKAEADRVEKHNLGLATIRGYADAGRAAGMTSERVLKGISTLEAMTFGAEWEEFAGQAEAAKEQSIATLKLIHADLVEKEAETARLAQQAKEQAKRKAELDRIAADQQAQAAALAAKQAELARQAEALAEQQRAAAAAEAQRQAAMAVQNTEEQRPQHVLKAEPATADATDRGMAADESPRVGAMGAGQAADAAPAGEPALIPVAEVIEHAEPPAPAPMVDDGREWKLGEISLTFGVTLTAAFVAQLGIEPARTDKAAKLFTTSQVLDIRARLVAHLMSLEIEYPA